MGLKRNLVPPSVWLVHAEQGEIDEVLVAKQNLIFLLGDCFEYFLLDDLLFLDVNGHIVICGLPFKLPDIGILSLQHTQVLLIVVHGFLAFFWGINTEPIIISIQIFFFDSNGTHLHIAFLEALFWLVEGDSVVFFGRL